MDRNETPQAAAERIASPTIGKVPPAVYREIVSDIETAIRNAYEDAAAIAENCTQDDAARDEPFRIAQTIREHAKHQGATDAKA